MMDILINKYPDRRKLYLSWDAASWHISKQLFARIDAHNETVAIEGGPLIETAPLPASAQFLNVIESVFSGMARAIIHNSNYKSIERQRSTDTLKIGMAIFNNIPRGPGKKSGVRSVSTRSFPTRTTARIHGIDSPCENGVGMSLIGTNRTNRTVLTMSVPRGNPEVAFRGRQDRF